MSSCEVQKYKYERSKGLAVPKDGDEDKLNVRIIRKLLEQVSVILKYFSETRVLYFIPNFRVIFLKHLSRKEQDMNQILMS